MAESKRLAAHRAGAPAVSAEETNPDVLLAGFNEEQMQAITAHLAPKAEMKPKENCSEDGDDDDENGNSDPEMDSKKKKAEEPDASATAMGNDRLPFVANAVLNDAAYKGKAEQALSMLADADYANVNASGLVKLLGKTPATTSASAAADADDKSDAAARAAMLAAIDETGNSNIDANAGGKPSGAANATAVWDRAIAKLPGSKAK